jgi:hypothetical protein
VHATRGGQPEPAQPARSAVPLGHGELLPAPAHPAHPPEELRLGKPPVRPSAGIPLQEDLPPGGCHHPVGHQLASEPRHADVTGRWRRGERNELQGVTGPQGGPHAHALDRDPPEALVRPPRLTHLRPSVTLGCRAIQSRMEKIRRVSRGTRVRRFTSSCAAAARGAATARFVHVAEPARGGGLDSLRAPGWRRASAPFCGGCRGRPPPPARARRWLPRRSRGGRGTPCRPGGP